MPSSRSSSRPVRRLAKPISSFLPGIAALSDGASDEKFLAALSFERTAPSALRAAAANESVGEFMAVWAGGAPASNRNALASEAWWSWSAYRDADSEPAWQAALAPRGKLANKSGVKARKPAKPAMKPAEARRERLMDIAARLQGAAAAGPVSHWPLLVALEWLEVAAGVLKPIELWPIWKLAAIGVGSLAASNTESPFADVKLVADGEIPYRAGWLFRGMEGAGALFTRGKACLRKDITAHTDTDGTPHADLVPRLPLWLAALVRATAAGASAGDKLWVGEDRQRFSETLEMTVPLCRPDGKLALSNALALEPLPVLTLAAKLLGLKPISLPGEYLGQIQRLAEGKTLRKFSGGVDASSSTQSDWAQLAHMRAGWSPTADSLTISYNAPLPELELSLLGQSFLKGRWGLSLNIGGKPVELAQEWSCVCWNSDPDADYLELQMQGPSRLHVERFVMLSRKDHFAILADSVRGTGLKAGSGELIQLSATLPVVDAGALKPVTGTREWQFKFGSVRGRMLPLPLASDTVDSTPHSAKLVGDAWQMTHVAEGNGCFAPIVLDWHPGRVRAGAQWTGLTVTETSKVVGKDVAAGFRWKIGDDQWLLYRSLKPIEDARAVLGHHTRKETVIAKFDGNGDVEPILLIE